MDVFFQFLIRLAFFIIGAAFFVLFLFVGFALFVFWAIKLLWYKITGKTPQGFNAFRFDPRQGFTYFYGRTGKQQEKAPRPSQRTLGDVTDVEVKEIHTSTDADRSGEEPPQS